MIKITTPISTLWDTKSNVNLIKLNSDFFEDRPFNNFNHPPSISSKVKAFHCDTIQPIHKLNIKDFDYIKSIVSKYPNLEIISFHCAYCSSKCFKHDGVGYIDGYCYTEEELKFNMKKNIPLIKEIVGDIKILIENNNYYPTKAYDIIANPNFISEIVYDNDIWFLFDQAHAEISAHNLKIKYEDYIQNLPLDRCKQIHLCKMGYNPSLYSKNFYLAEDYHLAPKFEEFQKTLKIINEYPLIEYLTIEYYKDINGLLDSIKTAKNL